MGYYIWYREEALGFLMYVVTLSVFHNLAIWLLYVNKPEPEPPVVAVNNIH